MTMKRTAITLLACLAAGAGQAVAGNTETAWTTGGFEQPESVLADPVRRELYVSNVAGVPDEKDGRGFISRMSEDGRVLEREWVDGLNAPKGMALFRGRLYVSDIDRLVVIDVADGAIVAEYPAPGARFLNDVTVDDAGRVYCSDMMANTLYRLADGEFAVWMRDPALLSPNGLLAEGERLVAGAWGRRSEGFATEHPGYLQSVPLDGGAVQPLGEGRPAAHVDGIVSDGGDGYFVTDWKAGKLFHADARGELTLVETLEPGSADLGRLPVQGTLLVPLMQSGQVVALDPE